TIPKLNDVVGINPVLGLGLGTPIAVVDSLALTTSTSDHSSAPCRELRRAVDGVKLSSMQLGRAGVEGVHQRAKGAKAGHVRLNALALRGRDRVPGHCVCA